MHTKKSKIFYQHVVDTKLKEYSSLEELKFIQYYLTVENILRQKNLLFILSLLHYCFKISVQASKSLGVPLYNFIKDRVNLCNKNY